MLSDQNEWQMSLKRYILIFLVKNKSKSQNKQKRKQSNKIAFRYCYKFVDIKQDICSISIYERCRMDFS